MSASNSRFVTSERGTRLVYHIGKRLCVVTNEATDRVIRIVTREKGLDQGGEFVRSERTFDQTSTGWMSKSGEKNKEVISVPREMAKAGLETYRSRG
jgi:hypothetical protein